MFGKIKNKLKDLFNKTQEVIEEDETIEEEILEEKTQKKSEIKEERTKKEIENKKESKTKQKVKIKKKGKSSSPAIKSPNEKSNSKQTDKPQEEEKIIEEENTEEPPSKEGEPPEEIQEEKKGFFSKLFSKKEAEESQEEEPPQEELKPEQTDKPQEEEKPIEELEEDTEETPKKEESFFKRAVKSVAQKKVTQEDFDKIWFDLEIFLLEINIAYEIVERIGNSLKEVLINNSFTRFKLNSKIREVLIEEVKKVLEKRETNFLEELKRFEKPIKILILGVNGTGKTTSIAKIVSYLQSQKMSVVIAAADTFRAAATEQLEEHAKKLDVKLIQHKGGSDPAAVAFDAIEHAKAKKLDVVLIDTAGRMPNNSNLILELQKIHKVSKSDLVLFVGDSISGNDLIEQIDLFNKAIQLNGILLTKVDTDEKPGSIVTTAYSIEQPIYFLGTGQNYKDLIPFNAEEISQKLFSIDDE